MMVTEMKQSKDYRLIETGYLNFDTRKPLLYGGKHLPILLIELSHLTLDDLDRWHSQGYSL